MLTGYFRLKLLSKKANDRQSKQGTRIGRSGFVIRLVSDDDERQRMVKSRQKKLDDRWGLEKSAKGGRFKLNRDLAGYHFTNRDAIEIEAQESKVKVRILDPPPLRTVGDLIHFENVGFKYKGARADVLGGVGFTVDQGGRCAFVGAVSL